MLFQFGTALLLSAALFAPARVWAAAEVYVLIDVSGSMRRTDPQNLRRPALRLLQRLLPEGARAGIWAFGETVKPLALPAVVDKAWRQKTAKISEAIHSRDQWTHIEAALETALAAWPETAGETQRNLILLTDGVVDIDKAPEPSAVSRQNILTKLLPDLRARQVKVLSVALSGEADHELLQRLAIDSDGWYERADSAEQLQRAFLRLFEKAAPPDTVPLEDNRFSVDASIREITVLVFRQADAPAAKLMQPDGAVITAADAPSWVKWQSEPGYDLITVQEPQPGEWRIDAELDPDNRVMVVTDLKMETGALPNQMAPGGRLSLEVWLSNQGNMIRKQGFLELVSASVEVASPAGVGAPILLERRQDGRFSTEIGSIDREGEYRFVIQVKSDTFIRERVHKLNVIAPITIQINATDAQDGHTVTVVPKPDFIATASMQVVAQILEPDGKRKRLLLNQNAEGVWQGKLTTPQAGDYRLQIMVDGVSPLGDVVHTQSQEFVVPGSAAAPVTPPPVAQAETTEIDWLQMTWQLGLINLILGLSGFGIYWWLNKRSRTDELNLFESET